MEEAHFFYPATGQNQSDAHSKERNVTAQAGSFFEDMCETEAKKLEDVSNRSLSVLDDHQVKISLHKFWTFLYRIFFWWMNLAKFVDHLYFWIRVNRCGSLNHLSLLKIFMYRGLYIFLLHTANSDFWCKNLTRGFNPTCGEVTLLKEEFNHLVNWMN